MTADGAVVVYANGGPDVGLGHLVRCTALTERLKARGVRTVLLAPQSGISNEFFEGYEFSPTPCEHSELIDRIEGDTPEVVVLDSYAFTGDEMQTVAEVTKTVVVDELGDRRLPVDLVVNNNVYADEIEYPLADEVLRGPKYCMLREEFRRERDVEVDAGSVLITIGGADLTGDFRAVVKSVSDVALAGSEVTAIVGPYFERDNAHGGVLYRTSPQNMAHLMKEADIAVSGGGQTLYELAACGTPCVAAVLGEDQRLNVEGMAKRKFCLSAGRPDESEFTQRLRRGVKTLLADPGRRQEMRVRGFNLVDGHGAERVAERIERLGERREPGSDR